MADGIVKRMTNQAFGLGLMTLTALLMLAVTVLLIDPAEAGTAMVLFVVLGGITYLVWRFETRWVAIVGLLVSIAAALTIFYIAFGIFQPFSPIEFIAGLTLVVGFLFALVGGIRAVIRPTRDGPPKGRGLRLGALALVGVASFISIVGFLFARTTVDDATASGAVVVEMRDFEFAPAGVTVAQGDQLLLTNADAFGHDFTLEEYDLHAYFGPGSEALVDVSNLPPGTYTYFCSLHTFEGEGMIGSLTIEN